MSIAARKQAKNYGLLLALGCWLAALPVSAAEPPVAWARIETVVRSHLASRPDYRRGDLLSREEVEPIFDELIQLGFQFAENEELYDSFLRPNDSLVTMLSTPAGRDFMRQVAQIPEVYDRLERLSWSETGRTLLADLIARPNGPRLLQSMLTPAGAKATEATLAADPRGKHFLRPTAHIHTEAELLARLWKSHAAQARAAGPSR